MTRIRLPRTFFTLASGLALVAIVPLGCGSGNHTADSGTDSGTMTTSGGLPAGYTVAVAVPSAATSHPENYGLNPSIAFDAMGDPAVAFTWYDPDNNDDESDSAVYFTHWNHATGRFDAPVLVGTAGDVGSPTRLVSLAYDISSSTFGIAFATKTSAGYGVSVAVSATGASFTAMDIGRMESSLISPSLAMGGGHVHLALLSNRNLSYVTGSETGAPGTWTPTMAPMFADQDNVAGVPSIALDSSGVPAIAYFATPSSAYNTRVVFWRPVGGAQSVAFDTQNQQNDDPYLSLAFHGTTAVVAAQVSRMSSDDAALYVATSTDGATWGSVATVPPDPGSDSGRVHLAVGAAGQGAITYDSGGGSGGTCGEPKLARSIDLTAWTTCSPDATGVLSIEPTNPSAGFGAGDRLVLAFNNRGSSSTGALASGLYVWREP